MAYCRSGITPMKMAYWYWYLYWYYPHETGIGFPVKRCRSHCSTGSVRQRLPGYCCYCGVHSIWNFGSVLLPIRNIFLLQNLSINWLTIAPYQDTAPAGTISTGTISVSYCRFNMFRAVHLQICCPQLTLYHCTNAVTWVECSAAMYENPRTVCWNICAWLVSPDNQTSQGHVVIYITTRVPARATGNLLLHQMWLFSFICAGIF